MAGSRGRPQMAHSTDPKLTIFTGESSSIYLCQVNRHYSVFPPHLYVLSGLFTSHHTFPFHWWSVHLIFVQQILPRDSDPCRLELGSLEVCFTDVSWISSPPHWGPPLRFLYWIPSSPQFTASSFLTSTPILVASTSCIAPNMSFEESHFWRTCWPKLSLVCHHTSLILQLQELLTLLPVSPLQGAGNLRLV